MPSDPNADTGEYRIFSQGPASTEVQVDLGALSHPGKVRANNEDCYLVTRFGRHLHVALTNLPEGHVLVRAEEAGCAMLVADGIGGMAAGEVASRLAATTLHNLVLSTADWILIPGERESEPILQRMAERYRAVDAALKQQARADPALTKMGTTMTIAGSVGSVLLLAHIGDSRAYLRHGAVLRQLTRDHTVAQEMVEAGELQPEEVPDHRLRCVLTRALGGGTGEPAQADVLRTRLRDGDDVLLCTDGLTEMVDDATIKDILANDVPAQEVCQALVEAALDRGGLDNVTVALARYRFPPAP